MTARRLLGALLACATAPVHAQSAPAHRFDPPLPMLPAAQASAHADFTGDGLVDRVYFDALAGRPMLSKGMPIGHFDLPRPVDGCGADCVPHESPAVIQADGDAAKELAFVGGRTLVILDLTPIGRSPKRLAFPLGEEATPPRAIDIDRDGLDDLVLTTRTDTYDADFRYLRRLTVFANRWPSGFVRRDGAPFPTSSHDTRLDPDTPDVDGDGLADLLSGACPGPCWVRQAPDGSFAWTRLDDVSGGTRTDVQHYRDIDEDGDADRVRAAEMLAHHVDLQVSPGVFEPVARLPDYGSGIAGIARFADLDGNGLQDVLYMSGGWIGRSLQESPGVFRHRPIPGAFERIEDIDGDGCADAVLYGNRWQRGRHCEVADVAVAAVGGDREFTARVAHVDGTREFVGETLRVTFAPAIEAAVADGKINRVDVVAPAACTELGVDAPRRTFDCAVGTLAPGDHAEFRFVVDATLRTRPFAALHGIAFRVGQADSFAGDDRAVAAIAHARASLAEPPTRPRIVRPVPAPVPADRTPSPRAGRVLQEIVR